MAEGVTNLNVPPPPDQKVVDVEKNGLGRLAEKWRAWFTALAEVTNWSVTGAFTAVTGVFSGALTVLTLTITGAAPATPAANTLYTGNIVKAHGYFTVNAGVSVTLVSGFNMDPPVWNSAGDYSVMIKAGVLSGGNYSTQLSFRNPATANTRGFQEKPGGVRTATQLDVFGYSTSAGGPAELAAFSVTILEAA